MSFTAEQSIHHQLRRTSDFLLANLNVSGSLLRQKLSVWLIVFLSSVASIAGQTPQMHNGAHDASSGAAEKKASEVKNNAAKFPAIPDTILINQDHQEVEFNKDLLRGKTVAINFIYTTCTSVCPLQGRNFSKLQDLLKDRLGKDIYLISITKDPRTDSPEKLKEWSKSFRPQPGWDFFTGDPAQVELLLQALIGGNERKGEHSPAILIINESKGIRERLYGLADAEIVAMTLKSVAEGNAPQPK
jgi:protein SCO1/2